MLAAASFLSLLAIALAYTGTLAALDASERSAGRAAVVNLNTVADSEALEPALSLTFPDPSERRSAARELFRFLTERRENGRQLPNVGALARARVETGTAAPATGLLLTSSQFAALKPSFTVRTREAFTNDLPPEVFKRPKMGFALPIGDWLRTTLRRWRVSVSPLRRASSRLPCRSSTLTPPSFATFVFRTRRIPP